MALMMTLKKGSIALTVCVNDTATCGRGRAGGRAGGATRMGTVRQ
jgi:hypothetical protein